MAGRASGLSAHRLPLLLLLVAALMALPPRARAQSPAADSVVYVVSPLSRLDVVTGKAGLMSFAGHEHRIRARAFSGRILYHAQALASSHIELDVSADSLQVLTPPDTTEIRKVTEAMRTDVLDVAHHPGIRFVSTAIGPSQGSPGRVRVSGTLTLTGVSRDVALEMVVQPGRDTLRASGSFTVKQTAFGIRPYRGGPGGTVRVADQVIFELEVVAVRTR